MNVTTDKDQTTLQSLVSSIAGIIKSLHKNMAYLKRLKILLSISVAISTVLVFQIYYTDNYTVTSIKRNIEEPETTHRDPSGITDDGELGIEFFITASWA